jgi:hypothetical protein
MNYLLQATTQPASPFDPTAITALVTAITALVAAIGGVVGAIVTLYHHGNQIAQNTQDIKEKK